MAASLNELEKAINSLGESLKLYNESMSNGAKVELIVALRDACIQRFEYSIEFCWKVSMKSLGSTVAAAKPAIREMARNGLISSPSLWLTYIDARNSSSHSYDETVAKLVFAKIESFYPEAKSLLDKLKKL